MINGGQSAHRGSDFRTAPIPRLLRGVGVRVRFLLLAGLTALVLLSLLLLPFLVVALRTKTWGGGGKKVEGPSRQQGGASTWYARTHARTQNDPVPTNGAGGRRL